MTHMSPTSASSSVTSSSQFSPVKLSTSSMDRTSVHGLPSTEMRRDSFPPYVSSSTKRSTAIVAPSVARTQSTPLSAAQSSPNLHSPLLPPSTHQRWLSASPLSNRPRSTQSVSKVMFNHRHGYPYSTSVTVCRSPGTRSLLGPPAASSGISYSLALSSAPASSSRSSAGLADASKLSVCLAHTRLTQMHPVSSSPGTSERHRNASNLSTCLAFIRHTPIDSLVDSFAGTSERRGTLLRDINDMYTDRRSTRELNTSVYNDLPFPATQRRTSAANTALTTVGRTTAASSQSLMRRANAMLAGYQPYVDLNQASRSATAQYSAAAFASSSATTVSSQLRSLQTPTNSGTFTEIC